MAAIDKTQDTEFDICWARGDTKPRVFAIQNSSGAVIDVSGSTFVMRVNTLLDPTPAIPGIVLFTATGAFVVDGIDGRVQFAPTPVSWADALVLPDVAFYDIEETDGNGDIDTLIKAKVLILQDIKK